MARDIQGNYSPLVVDSIADLRLTEPGDGIAGGNANLRGHTGVGDGGGGWFYWAPASVETDNDATIVKVATITTGRWKRLLNENLSIKMFGAIGDGSDQTAAMQNAYLWLASIGGGSIYWPEGDYAYSKTIFVGSNTTSHGDGYSTYIHRLASIPGETGERPNESGGGVPSHFVTFYALSTYRHSVAPNLYTIWATPVPDLSLVSSNHENIVFRDLRVEGTGAAGTPSVTSDINTFEIEGVRNFTLENSDVSYAVEIGIRAGGSGATDSDGAGENAVIDQVVFSNLGKAIEVEENQQSLFVTRCTAKVAISSYAVRSADCASTFVDDNEFSTELEPLYYAVQGHHIATNNDLTVTTAAERCVRIDGATVLKPRDRDVVVNISKNTINKGNISFAIASDEITYVSITDNIFTNKDGRIGNGNTATSFFGSGTATNFIGLGLIKNLFVDQILPKATDNSEYGRYKINTGEQEISNRAELAVGLSGEQIAGTGVTQIEVDTDTQANNFLFDNTGLFNAGTFSIDNPPTGVYTLSVSVALSTVGLAIGDRIGIYCQEIGGANPIIARTYKVISNTSQVQMITFSKLVMLENTRTYKFFIETTGATGPTIRSPGNETFFCINQES